MEGNGSGEKVIELYGSLWKTRESSISNLGKQDGKRSGVKYEKGRKELGKWEAVRDITPLLTSFRRQCHCQQRCSGHIQSWGEKGKPYNLRIRYKNHGDKDSQCHHGHSMSSDGNIQGNNNPQYCDLSYHTNCTSCHCPCPMHGWPDHGLRFELGDLSCP